MTGSARVAGLTLVAALALLVPCAPSWAGSDGVLFITSDPVGVEVTVDGRSVGKTPVTVRGVRPGEHIVRIVSDVYVGQGGRNEQKVTVVADEVATVSFRLREATGDFVLRSDLVGLRIIVDGKEVGVVQQGQEYRQAGLRIGPHTVALEGPFFAVSRVFHISKDTGASVEILASQHVGTLVVESTIPAVGVQINGKLVAEGPAPYTVRNLRPGSYLVTVLTQPVPYMGRVSVTEGQTSTVKLDSTSDVGKVIITSSLTGECEVRIDGVKVGDSVPLTVTGIVRGPHTVEVFGRPDGNEFIPTEEFLLIGRKTVDVPSGGTLVVDLSGDLLKGNSPDCPEGMVKLSAGVTEGEFWFKGWDERVHPAIGSPGESLYDMPLQGANLDLRAVGVDLSLSSVSGNPALDGPRRDLTTDPLANQTRYFQAAIPHDYCIDIYEYPNVRGAVPERLGFFDAAARCASRNKRLCTSVEWVRACSGPEKYAYPYGNEYDPSRCNTIDNPRSRGIAPAGSYPLCVNGYGLYDMSGNVAEWTVADVRFAISPRSSADERVLSTPALIYVAALKIDSFNEYEESPKTDFRGGSWLSAGWDASCRAMPSMIGSYIGTDNRPSFIEQLSQQWSSLDPETELPLAQGMLDQFRKSWNEGAWQRSAETVFTSGQIRGSAAYTNALENVAYNILRALGKDTHSGGGGAGGAGMGGPGMGGGSGMGMGGPGGMMGSGAPMMGGAGGGGGGGTSVTSTGYTVSRGSGPEARYLGSARLRGFRCCMFAHGLGTRAEESAQPGTMGIGGQGRGPGGAGGMLGPVGPGGG